MRTKETQPEKERKRLSEADKIVIEWVAMTSDSYNERQAWQRAYAALRRGYKGGAKDSTIAEAASRFANQQIVKDYLEVCRKRRRIMEREMREEIERDIFSSDERIREFVEKTGDTRLKAVYTDANEQTLESVVQELNMLKDEISDPKDKANILMKIAEFGGLKQNTQENHREFYMPMICVHDRREGSEGRGGKGRGGRVGHPRGGGHGAGAAVTPLLFNIIQLIEHVYGNKNKAESITAVRLEMTNINEQHNKRSLPVLLPLPHSEEPHAPRGTVGRIHLSELRLGRLEVHAGEPSLRGEIQHPDYSRARLSPVAVQQHRELLRPLNNGVYGEVHGSLRHPLRLLPVHEVERSPAAPHGPQVLWAVLGAPASGIAHEKAVVRLLAGCRRGLHARAHGRASPSSPSHSVRPATASAPPVSSFL